MAAEPVEEAADPAREAEKAPPTVLHGTLTVEVPGGETLVLKTTFDSGSNTDAVSEKVAIQLKKLGVPWGEAGGGVSMAVSSSVAVPHGELRLLLSAEPSGSDGRADELAIPRPLQFVTDALIMKDLSNDLIIGWPTGWMRWPKPDEICEYASPVVAAKQPQKGPDARRICADYRHINDCAKETRHPVKNQKEVMARLRLKTRFATFDLRKGYHQCKLTDRAAKLLAVATQDGLVIPITAPFGFHGLPAQFQYYISKLVLKELDGNGIESFIDDLNVNADELRN